MMRFHREIIRIHRSYESLRTGSVLMLVEEPGVLVFARMNESETVITAINNNPDERFVSVPVWRAGIGVSTILVRLIHSEADGFGTDAQLYIPRDGMLDLRIAGYGGIVLKNMRM